MEVECFMTLGPGLLFTKLVDQLLTIINFEGVRYYMKDWNIFSLVFVITAPTSKKYSRKNHSPFICFQIK
jgi:hypothetical protein